MAVLSSFLLTEIVKCCQVPLELAAEKEAVAALVKEWKGTKEGAQVCSPYSSETETICLFFRWMTMTSTST